MSSITFAILVLVLGTVIIMIIKKSHSQIKSGILLVVTGIAIALSFIIWDGFLFDKILFVPTQIDINSQTHVNFIPYPVVQNDGTIELVTWQRQ